MRLPRLHHLYREEHGSSLLGTLALITVLTFLAGAVLAVNLGLYRFIRRDAHRVQARYAAEAGVYVVLDSLQRNPHWRPQEHLVALPGGQQSRVTVEGFGGYLFVRAASPYRRTHSTVRALVGEIPPAEFRQAVVVWDAASSLHVAGHTRIGGDVVVGPRGLHKSTYRRRRFTGRIDGTVRALAEPRPPYFDGHFLAQAVAELDGLLGTPGAPPSDPARAYEPAWHLPSDNPIYTAPGSWTVTAADSMLLQMPVTLVAEDDLTLDGPLRFLPGTTFVAGQTLRLRGRITGREGLFYGRAGVEVGADVRCAGQFLSREAVRVARGVILDYPSVLYVTGEGAGQGATITVEDGAHVDGTLVYPPLDPEPSPAAGRIVVAPGAQLRGALYNAHETEFHGTLYGSLLTHRFYFYDSPTHYVNWLKDATIDARDRPIPYVLPLRFSPRPRLAVVHWETRTEDIAPPP